MSLELYHRRNCPASRLVRDYIEEAGLKSRIAFHDVDAEPAARDRLIHLTGGDQVPCLVIEGDPLLESDDIIAWLKTNLADAPRRARTPPSDAQPQY